MNVAVLGAGAVGARALRQLTATPTVERIVVSDIDEARARAAVLAMNDRRVATGDPSDTDDTDVAIVALPPCSHRQAAERLLERQVNVVSTSDAVEDVHALLALGAEARERGRTVIVGAGFAPGLTCVLATHAAAAFDTVDEVHVARVGTGGPACARQHHRALAGEALDWRDGAWLRRRGGSGRELCWFPDPVGAADCYRAAVPDAVLLVPAFPGVQRVTARIGANRRDRLTARLPMLRPPHPEGGPGAVRVEVRGQRGTVKDVTVLGAMDRPALAAGAVAALAAVWVGERRISATGATGLAGVVDPLPFLAELARRGVKAATFEGSSAS